jgi:hypothetical protein
VQNLGDPLWEGVARVSDRSRLDGKEKALGGTGRATAYLLLDVVQGVGRVDGEADEDDVRVGVGERAKTVVILLTGGIPKGQLDVLAVNLDIGDVVLEDGGDVDLLLVESARCS